MSETATQEKPKTRAEAFTALEKEAEKRLKSLLTEGNRCEAVKKQVDFLREIFDVDVVQAVKYAAFIDSALGELAEKNIIADMNIGKKSDGDGFQKLDAVMQGRLKASTGTKLFHLIHHEVKSRRKGRSLGMKEYPKLNPAESLGNVEYEWIDKANAKIEKEFPASK